MFVYLYMLIRIFLVNIFIDKLSAEEVKPNVIVIVADDMGWNDVSFHGSNQIPTPNIDALATSGIILNRHYVMPLCTPSRAAFMTGKHPINIGMQHFVIVPDEPWGLGLDQKIMPEYFKEAGYKTHMVGKWHLGMFKKEYTPTFRGFDSFLGYLGAHIDYYDHTLLLLDRKGRGLDMRRNLEIDSNSTGKYATDYFTEEAVTLITSHNTSDPLFLYVAHLAPHSGNEFIPLQAPIENIRKFNYIKDTNRRIYAAMVAKLDESVGKIFKALEDKNMLENSIILFFSDNGAPSIGLHANYGSNAPLKGIKNTIWEGGVRCPAIIWSPLLKTAPRVSNQWFHLSDWLHTFADLAGFEVPKHTEIDGMSQLKALQDENVRVRKSLLVNIDEIENYAAYIENGWKVVQGTTNEGKYDDYFGLVNGRVSEKQYIKLVQQSEIGSSLRLSNASIVEQRSKARLNCSESTKKMPCNSSKYPCLFNLNKDPCEFNNLARFQPRIVREMLSKVDLFKENSVSARNVKYDEYDPIYFNNTWSWWMDGINENENNKD